MNGDLVKKLFEINAIKVVSDEKDFFTYASGKKGPIYTDTRKIIFDHQVRDLFAERLIGLIKEQCPDLNFIGAMATGAITLGAITAERLQSHFFYIRSSSKAYGKKNLIEGLPEELKLNQLSGVIFEDLINSGGSVLKGIDAVTETPNLKIVSVLSIVDYEFSVAKNQIEKFCPQYSLVKLSDILEFMREEKMQGVDQLVSWHNSFYN